MRFLNIDDVVDIGLIRNKDLKDVKSHIRKVEDAAPEFYLRFKWTGFIDKLEGHKC